MCACCVTKRRVCYLSSTEVPHCVQWCYFTLRYIFTSTVRAVILYRVCTTNFNMYIKLFFIEINKELANKNFIYFPPPQCNFMMD